VTSNSVCINCLDAQLLACLLKICLGRKALVRKNKSQGERRCIAHLREDGTEELVETHLMEVASLAAKFSKEYGAEQSGRALGLIHDIGKFSSEFQRRIRDDGPKVDHSTAGAYELVKDDASWLAYCAAGHHGGLLDWRSPTSDATLYSRLRKAALGKIPDYHSHASNIVLHELPSLASLQSELLNKAQNCPKQTVHGINESLQRSFTVSFFIRMCFSSLVDADFLCTEEFMQGRPREAVPTDDIQALRDRFERKVQSFYPPKGMLNELRCGVSDDCRNAGITMEPGVFSLTVPTGGGKTLASLRFALQHACHNSMNRIIFAEPYTAIIEQTSAKFREYLDSGSTENILEHHSNFNFDALDDDPLRKNLRLASENWDMPIVVTTNVQLFESLYASGTSRCRKLHNIANSVIILDEAQAIPLENVDACIRVLVELVNNYHCSIVLCTATQPAFDEQFAQYGLTVKEIAKNRDELFVSLGRVTYKNLGCLSDDSLMSRLSTTEQVLCVVNSRAQAKNIANGLMGRCGQESVFHLSTLMYPVHRQRMLKRINERLSTGLPCRVVSTSLIEAGVDLDFPVVYRSLAGLDSIVQAAGRCNREGKRPSKSSLVYVFTSGANPDTGQPYRLPEDVKKRAGITSSTVSVSKDASVEYGSLENIRRYFLNLESIYRSALHYERNALEDLSVGINTKNNFGPNGNAAACCAIQFDSAEKDFKFIDDKSTSVIVPDDDIEDEVFRVKNGIASRGDLRRISRYSVSVYQHTLETLVQTGRVEQSNGAYILSSMQWYSDKTGLDCGDQQGEGMFW
jgi:CRISPR-associated endonuclease/helicase Cas3